VVAPAPGSRSIGDDSADSLQVVALDASDILDDAARIIEANGLSQTISTVKGKAEAVDLAPLLTSDGGDGKADVLVSEWMGYALLYGASGGRRDGSSVGST
jgi:protein arginine N-methyltransferase 1